MIHKKENLILQLEKSGLKPHDTVLVHSSMKAAGQTENGADTVIDAFMEYFSEGLLIFPTHTWASINRDNTFYDSLTAKPCVGVLPELFLKRPGVIRSLHPTHSLAAVGKNAEDFLSGEENASTPCPRSGCYGKLYDLDSRIIFIGCSLKSNTILHGAEEWNDVPQRLSDEYLPLKIKTPSGEILECPMRTHSQKYGDISRNYDKIEPVLMRYKIAVKTKIGDAETYICRTREMIDIVSQLLQKNHDLFINSDPIPNVILKV